MSIRQKLISYFHRAISKDPESFVAMKIHCSSEMTWSVDNEVLTLVVSGNTYSFDLSLYSLGSLVTVIDVIAGVSIPTSPSAEHEVLSARTLLECSGNGVDFTVTAFGAIPWAYEDAVSAELNEAAAEVENAILQMSIPTAEEYWLEYWAGFFGIDRNLDETDDSFGPRIVAEVLFPKVNNKAMELAIFQATGRTSRVVDVTENNDAFPFYDGTITYDGSAYYNSTGVDINGLFDLAYVCNLETVSDVSEFQSIAIPLIERLRASGCYLRNYIIEGEFKDSVREASESLCFSIGRQYYYDGIITYDGAYVCGINEESYECLTD